MPAVPDKAAGKVLLWPFSREGWDDMRPFVLVGFVYLLTLTAAVCFGAEAALAAGCVCMGLCAVLLLIRRFPLFAVSLAVAAAALGSFNVWTETVVLPAETMAGKDAFFTGTICELPESSYGRFYYIVEVDSIEWEDAPDVGKIRLSAQNALAVEPYDRIRGRAHFFLPAEGEGFDKRSYYISKGILLSAYLYDYEEKQIFPAESLPPYGYALKARAALKNSLYELLPEREAGLAVGVLLGDKSGISGEIEEAFRTGGVSHLLAVSGMHMAAIYQMLSLLLGRLLRLPKRLTCLLSMAGIAAFMAITGFAPSVVRSGLMYLIFLTGMMVSRQPDSLNSLGASVFLMCAVNPYAAADLGLLLSFAATASIILFSGRTAHWIRRFLPFQGKPPSGGKCRAALHRTGRGLFRQLAGDISTTLTASAGTAPIIMLSFGTFSTVFLLANLLLLFPSTLLLECSAIAAILHLVPFLDPAASVFAFLTGILARYSWVCAELLAQIPYASLPASDGFLILWLCGTLILFGIAVMIRRRRVSCLAAGIASVLLFVCGFASDAVLMRQTARIAVIDVGDGISVLAEKGGNSALIGSDSYSSVNISRFLQGESIRTLGYFQPSGTEDDEHDLAAAVIREFSPEKTVIPADEVLNAFLEQALPQAGRVLFCGGREFQPLWEGAAVETLFSEEGSCTLLAVDGVTVLICGRGCPIEAVPLSWRSPDLFVCSELPEDAALLRPALTVLSMSAETAAETIANAPAGTYVATGAEGDLIFDVSGGRVKIRKGH